MQLSSALARAKLPRRFAPFVFAFYMSAIMALLMCSIIVGVTMGVHPGYVRQVLSVYVIAMPTAFVCILVVRPVAARLVAATVRS